jgi:hypothetical protein
MIGNLVIPARTPDVIDPSDTEHIAREALFEALEALTSYRTVTSAMFGAGGGVTRFIGSLRRVRDDIEDAAEEALDDAVEDMPAVLLMSSVLRQTNDALSRLYIPSNNYDDEKATSNQSLAFRVKTPAEVWGWTNAEYEAKVLGGFGTAEEWERRIAVVMKGEVERILSALAGVVAGGSGEKGTAGLGVAEAVDWVRCLGLIGEGRCAVKAVGVL